MSHGLFVCLTSFNGELAGAFVEHCRHFLRLRRRTTHACQCLREHGQIHERVLTPPPQAAADADTMRMLSTFMRFVGRLFSPPPPEVVAVSPMRPRTSSPLVS